MLGLGSPKAWAQEPVETPDTTKYQINTKYTTEDGILKNPSALRPIDTVLHSLQQFDSSQKTDNRYSNLGNYGSPAFSLDMLPWQPATGFNFGINHWDAYRLKAEDVKYFNTTTPYFDFFYVQDLNEMQQFSAFHSQNIMRNWNAAVQYKRYVAPGYYNGQKAGTTNGGVNTWYFSPNRKYMVMASALWNKFDFQENGGIANDTAFLSSNTSTFDRQVSPVRLYYERAFTPLPGYSPSQQFKDQNYSLRQILYFGKKQEASIKDTDSVVVHYIVPKFYLSHKANFYQQNYYFKDTLLDNAQYSFTKDTSGTYDKLSYYDFSNEFSIGGTTYSNDTLLNGLAYRAFVVHDFINTRQDTFRAQFSNLTIGGEVRAVYYVGLKLSFHYTILGYNQGDYHAAATLFRDLKLKNSSYSAGLRLQIDHNQPSYTDNIRVMNHFEWVSNFKKTTTNSALLWAGTSKDPALLTVQYLLVNNLVYYNQEAKPVQASANLNYINFRLNKTFKVWWLTFDNSLTYQKVLSGDYVHLPAFAGRISWYFDHPHWFHSPLHFQAGFDIRYNSSYYSNAWMPGLSKFYLQDSVKTGNYPFVDVWVALRVKTFQAFAKIEHVNEGLNGNDYFLAPHYPALPRSVFLFGVRWKFFK